MDIEKLIEQLKWWAKECDRTNKGCQARRILQDAATALSTLQDENEKLQKMYQEEKAVCHATQAELERMKQERDALIEDFVDYVTGGVPNPAIFCKNRCDKCTDMRGWCTGKDCAGFYPSASSRQKED